MKRRNFVAALSALAAASCARVDNRQARYNPRECPFCSTRSGVCGYCNGKTACTFCSGTGVRKTSTKNVPDPSFKQVEYEEECPYCGGSGACKYCDGVGKCWACHGTGEIEDWNFQQTAKQKPSLPKSEK
jgi:RecJ-like exonuclease